MAARFPALELIELSERQQEIVTEMSQGPRGGVGGPFKILIHKPDLAQAVQSLGLQCRFGTFLTRRQSELVILLAVRDAKSSYPWFAHREMAVNAGLEAHVIESIEHGQPPRFTDNVDSVIHQMVYELLETKRLSDDTFATASTLFGIEGILEVVSLAGYYALIGMVMNAFNFPMPEGTPEPF